MRFLVFLFFFSFLNLISVYSQDKLLGILPIVDSKVTYIGVIEVDGVSKDDLYYRAKRWFIDYYNSGKDVIQLDDKENGEIIGKGFFTKIWVASALLKPIDVNVWQTVTIQVKDGKFRYMISDFQIRYFSSGGGGVS